ncbi:MAG: PEP-CTERM sorting domain-containing protein [Acidobacteria bacterium]|nr:PEP-CTERM sorting domain-containing protein [Acidobacteriota bacterium]
MKFKVILFSALAGLLSLAPAQAAVLYTAAAGSTTASLVTNTTDFNVLDVRGSGAGFLSNSEVAFLVDSQNGTDPNFQTLAFGNLVLTALSAGPNFGSLTFGAFTLGANTLAVEVVGANIQDTNGGLSPIIGGPFIANFALRSLNTFGQEGSGLFLAQYDLINISTIPANEAIPEPSTWVMIGCAVPGILVYARRRRS